MIKILFGMYRHWSLSAVEFTTYWRDTHAGLIQAHASDLKISSYSQHDAMPTVASALAAIRGSQGRTFDGVAELVWPDEQAFRQGIGSDAAKRAGAVLLADEARFVDLTSSIIFAGSERRIIG
jgi:uncharacterized protein (TIGR02118 family)